MIAVIPRWVKEGGDDSGCPFIGGRPIQFLPSIPEPALDWPSFCFALPASAVVLPCRHILGGRVSPIRIVRVGDLRRDRVQHQLRSERNHQTHAVLEAAPPPPSSFRQNKPTTPGFFARRRHPRMTCHADASSSCPPLTFDFSHAHHRMNFARRRR